MKGLSQVMFIVVSVIVILIVALVVLTIFGGIGPQVGTIVEARNNCRLTADNSCASTGTLPVTWGIPSQQTDQGILPCSSSLIWGPNCFCDANRNFVC